MTQTELFDRFDTTPNTLPDFSGHGCVTDGSPESWAVFSECRKFRYLLARMWDTSRPVLVMCGQNPSIAGAADPDQTVTKVVGFAKRHGCGGVIMCNLGARIATDERELRNMSDPVGPFNATAIRWAFKAPMLSRRLAAWGKLPKWLDRRIGGSIPTVMLHGAPLKCLGKNGDGSPRHPLMLAYATPLEPWP